MDGFGEAWDALRAAVAAVPDGDFDRPSGCRGWLVRDLVFHLVIDAQDVLITLVTPSEAEPTDDAATYRKVSDEPPTGDDPLDALTVRLAEVAGPPAGTLGAARGLLERIAGAAFPESMSDRDVLLVGTGRRAPTDAERAALGGRRLPLVLG